MDEPPGRWTSPPILPELAPPPKHLIQVRGAQVIRVHHIDDPNPKLRGHTEAVVLAWALLPQDDVADWAGLCAWLSGWHGDGPHGAHTTGRGRYGWYRMLTDRVEYWRPPHPYLSGSLGWHGLGDPGEVSSAIEAAAATLPQRLQQAALTPYVPGPAEGSPN